MLCEVSYHFQLELIKLGFLVSAEKNLKDWVRTNVRVVPQKLSVCGHRGYELLPCFGVGDSFLKFTQTKMHNKF